jgi:hypothetical protein
MTNITIIFHYYDVSQWPSFSLSGRDGDSNRLQPAGQNPYHMPVRVCTSLAWVTIRPIRRWVWTEPQGLGDGWCQVAQIKPAHGQSQVAQVMPAHGQPLPLHFISRLSAMRTTVQISPRTWYLASQSEQVTWPLCERYVQSQPRASQRSGP